MRRAGFTQLSRVLQWPDTVRDHAARLLTLAIRADSDSASSGRRIYEHQPLPIGASPPSNGQSDILPDNGQSGILFDLSQTTVNFYPAGAVVRGTGTTAYAWFVWDKQSANRGTELKWLPLGYKARYASSAKSDSVKSENPMLFK